MARSSQEKTSNKKVSRQVSLQRSASAPERLSSRGQGRLSDIALAMLADLERSGINRRGAQRLRVLPLNADDTRTLSKGVFIDPSYRLPYFKLDGSVDLRFFRLKRLSLKSGLAELDASSDAAEQARRAAKKYPYFQPYDSIPRLYIPPLLAKGLSWQTIASDPSIPIYITEGEKKAAKGCLMGVVCAGLGGVWNFKSKKGGLPLIPDLKMIDWRNRKAIIVFDSDVAGRSSLTFAQNSLAIALTDLGAQVSKIDPPANEAQADKKVGLDDYFLRSTLKDFLALPVVTLEYSNELWALNEAYVFSYDPPATIINRATDQLLSEVEFKSNERPRKLLINNKPVEAAKHWLGWNMRAQVSKLVYEPRVQGAPRQFDDGTYNLWQGWGVESAEAGDVTLFTQLLEHLLSETREPEARTAFVQWLAYPFQNPGDKMLWAVLMHGETQGAGKTLLGYTLRELYGFDNHSEVLPSQLASQFNEYVARKQIIQVEEIVADSFHKYDLKPKITNENITINPKNKRPYTIKDTSNWLFLSNASKAIDLPNGDRRFLVIKINKKLPVSIQKPYDRWFKSKAALSAIMNYLLNVDMRGFEPKLAPPMTEAKVEMTKNGRGELENFIVSAIDDYDEVFAEPGGKAPRCDFQTAEAVFKRYVADRHSLGTWPSHNDTLGKVHILLHKYVDEGRLHRWQQALKSKKSAIKPFRAFAFRNVKKWRNTTSTEAFAHWDEAQKQPFAK
jgi:hypothetical protein